MTKAVFAAVVAMLFFAPACPVAADNASSEEIVLRDETGDVIRLAVRLPSSLPLTSRLLGLLGIGANSPQRRHPLVLLDWGEPPDDFGQSELNASLLRAGFATATLRGGENAPSAGTGPRLRELFDRPRRLNLAIEHLLSAWPGRNSLDGSVVAVAGRSIGAFAALVAVGAAPEGEAVDGLCFSGRVTRCSRDEVSSALESGRGLIRWVHTPRVTAAIVVDPDVTAAFTSRSLMSVRVPVSVRSLSGPANSGDTGARLQQLGSASADRREPSNSSELCSKVAPTAMNWNCEAASSPDERDFAAQLSAILVRHRAERIREDR
jgi:predicted dienelactone hydrolase